MRSAVITMCAVGLLMFVLSAPAYCQEAPEEKPGPAGEKDAPFEVPVSPGEKKALQEPGEDGKEEEGGYDVVVLPDGTKIKGRVVDSGGPVIWVRQPLGSVSILKSRIKELHLHSDPESEELDEDVVYLSSGQIRGHARISEDGKKLTVTFVRDGQKQTVTFPYSEVLKIERAKDRRKQLKEQFGGFKDPLSGKIEKMLEELSSSDGAVWQAARDRLVKLGVFAVDYLKERLKELDPQTASRTREILKTNEIKSYVSPEAVMLLKKDVYERLVSGETQEKVKLLRQLVLLEEDGAVLLLAYLAGQSDESAEVRNFCLDRLAKADRNQELLGLMTGAGEEEGWLRLACALYLADNGIYAGAPYFISALRMRDPAKRKMAAQKLRQASGKNFGFVPEGTEAQREAAIKKWEDWWGKHNAEILRQSAKVLGASPADEDDRSFSDVYQKRGYAAWDKGKTQEAAESFRKALELDPGNLTARLSLAIVLYTSLRESSEARRELKLILKRYGGEAGPMVRKLAFYHCGLIDLSEYNWAGALHNLQAALALDRAFADGYIALGNAYYIQAVSDPEISREKLLRLDESKREECTRQRNQVIERSVRALETGLARLDEDIHSLTSLKFRQERRKAERELQEELQKELGVKAEGPVTRTQDEAAFKEMLLKKKARALAMLADSYALGLEWRKAARCLRDAARLEPKEAKYLCKLGSALAAAGRRQEAREAFERTLSIEPQNEEAIRGLEDLK